MRLLSSLLNNLKFRNFFVTVTTHNVINTLKVHKLTGLKLNVPTLKIIKCIHIIGCDRLSKGLEPTGIEPPAGAINRKTLPLIFNTPRNMQGLLTATFYWNVIPIRIHLIQ